MRIGYDAKRAFHNKSGLGNYSRDLIRILAEAHPEQDFYLFNPKQLRSLDFGHDWENVHEVGPSSLLSKVVHPIWRSRTIINSLEKLEIDVYHGLSNELPIGLSRSSVKGILTVHDLIFMRYPKLYKPTDRLSYRKKMSHACQDATQIVAISEQTKEDLVHYMNVPKEKIEVIYQGCHPEFGVEQSTAELKAVKTEFELDKDFMLSVGTIEKRKNQESIVKALPLVKELDLVLVGKHSSYFHRLKKLAASLGVLHRVHFLEKVPTRQLSALYQLAKVFAYPSIFEGFGIPIIEALKSKCPIITSSGGVFSETAGPNSLYIDAQDFEALAKKTNELMNTPALVSEMQLAGLDYVQRFNENEIGRKWMSLYQSL